MDNGSITNTGTASGNPPTGAPITAASTLSIPALQQPAIGLAKSADVPRYSAAGTPITYTYLVTNSGNVTLLSVGVTDPMPGLSPILCGTPPAALVTLSAGQSVTCTATYTTTQADVDRGSLTNTGTASGTPPPGTGSPLTAQSSVTIPATQDPVIAVVKSADVTSYSTTGTVITYSYAVTNPGNVTLTSVGVNDPMSGLSAIDCQGITTLAPGDSVTCTATYTTTQADLDNGSVDNIGTASGTDPTGSVITDTSPLSIPAMQEPAITLVKSAAISSFSTAGTTVMYRYLITNTGNVTLTGVTVDDPMVNLSPIVCPKPLLVPGTFMECNATYTTTQADVDAGQITNTGTATGTPPSGQPLSASDTLILPATQTPTMSLIKTASVPSFSASGTPITYSYLVTNTGNVTLTDVGVTDPMPGLSPINCGTPPVTLAPNAAVTCTATYTTTDANVAAGAITNIGTASGTPPSGTMITASNSVTVPLATIGLVKTASVANFDQAGQPISYSYTVTNTGEVELTDVVVDDDLVAGITCPTGTLAPNESVTCTGSYTTVAADVTAGEVTNSATATGTTPSQSKVTATVSLTVPLAAIDLVKTADVSSYDQPGQPITYTYVATNTGQVALAPVTVVDGMSGLSPLDCQNLPGLSPGQSITCTATYTTTQADVDRGSLSNIAIATGTPVSGPDVMASSTVTISASQKPAISIVKTASITAFSKPGTPVTYTYKITNTGNVTLTKVAVTDNRLGSITCPSPTLATGATETCTATYTTTQADVDRGSLSNTATASGTPESGGPAVTAQTSVTVPATQHPGISVVKSASVTSYVAAGTKITYSYKVTNTGNVSLSDLTVTDAMAGLSAITCPATTLAPGASVTCTATYTVTAQDLVNGKITNTATASGKDPGGAVVKSAASSVTIPDVPDQTPARPCTSTRTGEPGHTFSRTRDRLSNATGIGQAALTTEGYECKEPSQDRNAARIADADAHWTAVAAMGRSHRGVRSRPRRLRRR